MSTQSTTYEIIQLFYINNVQMSWKISPRTTKCNLIKFVLVLIEIQSKHDIRTYLRKFHLISKKIKDF